MLALFLYAEANWFDVAVILIPQCWLALRSHALILSLWRSQHLILQPIGSMGITYALIFFILETPLCFFFKFHWEMRLSVFEHLSTPLTCSIVLYNVNCEHQAWKIVS